MSQKKTIGIASVIVFALAVHYFHSVWLVLVFERDNILSGEVWRLVTGHFVHFDLKHLLIDISMFAILSVLVKKHWGKLCVYSAFFIGLVIFFFEPNINTYGGLSGICVSLFVYSAIERKSFMMLFLILLKIGYEYLFLYHTELAVMAHIAGYGSAVCFALMRDVTRSISPESSPKPNDQDRPVLQ